MKATIYTKEGKKAGSVDLPENVFGAAWNDALVHQVITSMQSNARIPFAHTKDRSEVRGGGRKPWRQKGTGRARHGSSRSPIWKGGGVTFGPRNERNFNKKINKKMKAKALYSILSAKYNDGEVIFVDSLDLDNGKTSEAKTIVSALSKVEGLDMLSSKKKNAVAINTDGNKEMTARAFSNFSNMKCDDVANINPLDLMTYKYVIIENPEKTLEALSQKLATKLK